MKHLLCALCALLVINTSYAEEAQTQEESIIAQEKAWAAALLASKLDVVDALMHSNFRLIRAYSDAPPIDKASYLGMQGMSASSVEVTSAKVNVVGNVAVAQATWSLDWQQEGVGKLPPHFKLTDVWIKGQDKIWRILSRVSQIADAPPADSN